MFAPTTYSAMEQLPNGAQVEIHALRPDDRAELIAVVDRASSQSLYRRFFGAKRSFTEKEIDFFLNVDLSATLLWWQCWMKGADLRSSAAVVTSYCSLARPRWPS
jgi:hypothetical protein